MTNTLLGAQHILLVEDAPLLLSVSRIHSPEQRAQGSKATGTASVLTVWYLLSVPIDDPT